MVEPIDALFSTPKMSAAFSPEAPVRGMLAFETVLARSEARAGIIPHEAAETRAALTASDIVLADTGAIKMWMAHLYPTYQPNTTTRKSRWWNIHSRECVLT